MGTTIAGALRWEAAQDETGAGVLTGRHGRLGADVMAGA